MMKEIYLCSFLDFIKAEADTVIGLLNFGSGEGTLATGLVRDNLEDNDCELGELRNMARSGERLPYHNRIGAFLGRIST
jgi:hypothetical protein